MCYIIFFWFILMCYIIFFWFILMCYIIFSPAWRDSPNLRHGLLIHEVSRSHTTTHHSR